MTPSTSSAGWVDPAENGGFVIPYAHEAQATNPFMVTYGASERDKQDDVDQAEGGNRMLLRAMAPWGQIDRAQFAALTGVWYSDPGQDAPDPRMFAGTQRGDMLTLTLR